MGSKILQLSLCVLIMLGGVTLCAQISGVVTDADLGEPLIGATVAIKEADGSVSAGTITDFDGNFTIEASDGDLLLISYTGYQPLEITATSGAPMNIVLSAGVNIQEVVVTGYSVDTRRSTPGSVATVDAADLQAIPSSNIEQQLQGRVAGVTVITNGQPGSTSKVRIRGFGALGGNQPLYIVDGVPVGSTDFLSPDEIQTTTVLKDATSASIYGARAAGGVVVYTTKKGGRNQPLKVTYDGLFGVTTPGDGIDQMNPQDFANWTWTAIRNAAIANGETPSFEHAQFGTGQTPVIPDYLLVGSESGVIGNVDLGAEAANYNIDPRVGSIYQVIRANQNGTDWYDAITRTGMLNRHNIGFSGGGERSRYYLGMAIQDQEGTLLHQKYSRYSLRANTEFDITSSIRIGENIQATLIDQNYILGGGGGSGSSDDENVINHAYRMASIIPLYDEFGGYAGTAAPGFNNPRNPVATLDGMRDDNIENLSLFGNIYLEIEPIQNLVFRSSFGGWYNDGLARTYTRRQYENSENNASYAYSEFSQNNSNWVWTNTVNYAFQIGHDHKFNVLLGQEALNTGKFRQNSVTGLNPFEQTTSFINISTVSNISATGLHSDGVNFSSYFGQLKYDLMDKYIISAVLRRDGSSRFGADNRYGTFPAFSGAWRISSEPFMSGVAWIDDLKIKGGYGIMGNSNNVNPNNQFTLFTSTIAYDVNGTNSNAAEGFYQSRIGNASAKWEKAITTNIGFDALLFNSKLDIGLDIWTKKTEDLLFQVPVTVQSGELAEAPSVNVGEMENKGVDLKIVYKNRERKLGYEITVNGGFLSNEIVALSDGVESLPNQSINIRGLVPTLNQVGQSLSAFYGYNVVGLFRDQAEVDAAATQEGAAPGRFRFEDINNDGVINTDDRTTLGDPIPDFTGGLTVKLEYSNFELEVYSFASIGNEIYNASRLFTDFYPLFPGASISERVKGSWTPDNTGAEIPIFENIANFSTTGQSNSYYVEDGSYFRLQNLTIGYKLPKYIIDKWNMTKFRVYVGMNNLFTITDYSGLDPSVGGDADINFGIDVGNVPLSRTYTVGLNLGF